MSSLFQAGLEGIDLAQNPLSNYFFFYNIIFLIFFFLKKKKKKKKKKKIIIIIIYSLILFCFKIKNEGLIYI